MHGRKKKTGSSAFLSCRSFTKLHVRITTCYGFTFAVMGAVKVDLIGQQRLIAETKVFEQAIEKKGVFTVSL